jgi:hypothetical protein
MKSNTLQYYMHDGPGAFRFELSGNLTVEGARRLDQDWRTASSVIGGRMLIVDMTFVTDADDAGRELLIRWHRAGAHLITASKASRALAEQIVGEPFREYTAVDKTSAGGTWLPFRSVFASGVSSFMLGAALLLMPARAEAATLKPETVSAWNGYVEAASAAQREHVRSGAQFLWIDEDSEILEKVRGGEAVAMPIVARHPVKVPGGSIHHWIGAAFVPHAKLDDALDVMRDYEHYREYYSPSVVESKVTARDETTDRFSMLLMNRAFFMKMALDADYQTINLRVDRRRFYSVSKTTRLQEIEDLGQPGERRIPQGEGAGYVWKLFTITRLDEREGGLFIEVETSALSREVPGALRIVADPILRRVSRGSMELLIRQTAEAVRNHTDSSAARLAVHNR